MSFGPAENVPTDMAEISRVTFAPRNIENLLEMQNLRRAHDVPKSHPLQIVDPIIDGGDVRGA